MDAQTYLKKFSRIVRWKLPKSEADEVLTDYQEMLAQCSGETTQALGQPAQAARLLSEPKMYYRWLAVFGLLTFCLLLSEFFLLRASFAQYPTVRMYLLLFVGLIGSLLWFRPQPGEDRKSSLPKGLGPMLLGLLALAVAVAGLLAGLAQGVWQALPAGLYGRVANGALLLMGTAAAIFGLFGLVHARLSDRRWCALYSLGFTVLVECVLVHALLVNMSLDTSLTGWWVPYGVHFGIVGIFGLLATGRSLC